MMRWRHCWVLASLATVLACGGGGPTGGVDAPPDGSDPGGAVDVPAEVLILPDVRDVPALEPGGPDPAPELVDASGDPVVDADPDIVADSAGDAPDAWVHCLDRSECAFEACVPAPGGAGKVCAPPCADGACPDGWTCRRVEIHPDDVIELCLPRTDLCKPCDTDLDCQPFGLSIRDLCVFRSDASGSVCGQDCEENGRCPEGFTCRAVERLAAIFRQCLPDADACGCNPSWQEAESRCFRANGLGRCKGLRTCSGGVETPCDAAEAVPETCNGLDDDCDGVIDDGFSASGLYLTDEHCGDCATSCVGLVPNGKAACRLIDDRPVCRLTACDPGYVESAPGQCTWDGRGACGPCRSDVDCAAGLACLPVGGATFCLLACDPTVPSCPADLVCGPPADGQPAACLRASGGCGAPGTECTRDADCEDLDACTVGTCRQKACVLTPASCDDGNPCSSWTCDRVAGCVAEALADDTACSDGDPCTQGDACQGGLCVPGPRPDCDDGNVCTDDSCRAGNCVHDPNTYSEPCYTGPPGTSFVGTCSPGMRRCGAGSMGACLGEIIPATESCDGRNHDCDKEIDEGCDLVGADLRPAAASLAGSLGGSGGRLEALVGAGPGGLSSSPTAGYEIVLGFCGN